jgi:tetratricopeptide (TPR) repeat protein
VRSSIGVSYDALRCAEGAEDRFAASLFPRLVLVPVADITPRFAAALAGQTELEPVKAALDRLLELHLLQARSAGRYGLHDLVRLFALEQNDQLPDRDTAIVRVLDLYLASARRVHQVLLPNRPLRGDPVDRQDLQPVGVDSMQEANAWLDGELPNVLTAARFVAQTGCMPLFSLRLSNSLHIVLGKRAAWSAERQLADFAIAATAPAAAGVDHCDAVRALGQAELHLGNLTEAAVRLAEAVELARAAGERRRQAAALLDLARVALLNGDYALARSQMTECVDMARSDGLAMVEAIALLNLSSVHVSERRWGEAREALEASLRVRRERDDVAGLSVVLPALAYVEFELGDASRALELLEEGQHACRTVGNDVDGWYVLFIRSVMRLTTGSVRLALRDAAAAMRICVPGRDYEIASTLRLLAAAFAAAGKTDLATDYQHRAANAAYSGRTVSSVEMLLARCQAPVS